MLLPIIISGVGIYFLVKLRAFFILHPIRTLREISRERNGRGAFLSLCLALAGTLGVGNIVGVSVGIATGGAGCLFWLVLSSALSSVIKYAEIIISEDDRQKDGTGIIAVIKGSLGRRASMLYAALYVLLSLTLGSALQMRAVADSLCCAFNLSGAPVFFLCTLGVAAVVIGGVRKIEKCTAVLIPLAASTYLILSIAVIAKNVSALPYVLGRVFSEAFSLRAASGGIIGSAFARGISEGFARGLLSNEAGAGTSTLAHARAGGKDPHVRGLFGIIEVFFDTTVLCATTGLALLASGANIGEGGADVVLNIFEGELGRIGASILAICILLFAISTVFCQYFYGSFCANLLFGRRYKYVYFPLFLALCAYGMIASVTHLITASDLLLTAMTALSSLSVVRSSERIKEISRTK